MSVWQIRSVNETPQARTGEEDTLHADRAHSTQRWGATKRGDTDQL